MAPRILMGCVNYWTSPFQVGSHHLARQFVRAGYEVAFVSEPITPLHLIGKRGQDLANRLQLCRHGGQCSADGKVWAYVPAALLTPQNRLGLRSAWLHQNWWRLTVPSVVRTVTCQGFGVVDVLYLDSVKQHFWLDQIEARCTIYRVADHNRGFGTFAAPMERLEERLIRTVDIVAYSSERLGDLVRPLRPRQMVYLPNGVDFSHFQGPWPEPPEYLSLPRPRIIYVGALESWFDYKLVAHAASAMPQASFILIGPAEQAQQRLAGQPNVHLLGPRPYHEMPAYLHHADVGIIPFDVAGRPELIHAVNPLKLYEYLACGLPVVATEWEALRNLRSPAHIAATPEQFVYELQRAVSTPGDRSAALTYAARMDWSRCAVPLLRLIEGRTAQERAGRAG